MKKIKLFLILLFVSLITIACANTDEDKTAVANQKEVIYTSALYKNYDDVKSLEDYSDLIVKGTVIGTTVDWIDASMDPDATDDERSNPGGEVDRTKEIFTVHKVRVDNSYKGDIEKGDIIEVKQFGGETENTIMIDEDVTYLEEDKEYILYLETYEDSPATLLNPIQAYYRYDNGKIIKNPQNSLTLNIDTLEKLEKK